MIKFGYLKGYNSYNVPAFQDVSTRDNFFDNIDNLVELDAYYPPYFTNVIKVSNDEVPQSQPFNFVILVHNNKHYYYFIDNIQYLDEDIYNIQITMDTILTYMFDIKIKDCVVTRNSINRWYIENNVRYINRDYIRENLSEGVFEINKFEQNDELSWALILVSKEWLQSISGYPSGRIPSNCKMRSSDTSRTEYDLGYEVLAMPLVYGFLRINATDIASTNTKDISNFIDNPYVINIYIVNNDIMDKVFDITSKGYISSNRYQIITSGGTPLLLADWETSSKTEDTNIIPITLYDIDKNLKNFDTKNYNIKGVVFENNNSINNLFNSKFIPQLIDENYYQIEYGNFTGFSSYPLHQSKSLEFTLNREITLNNADVLFSIRDSYDNTNKFNINNVSMPSSIDLVTDAWKSYQAQNKGTLSTGLKLQYKNTLYDTVKNTIMATVGAQQADNRYEKYKELLSTRKDGGLLEMGKINAAQQATMGVFKGVTAFTDGLMQAYNIKKNYQINKENYDYSPDIAKITTSYYSEYLSDTNTPFLKESTVNDIEAVARKLELYGYKQNKTNVYTNPYYLFEIEKNRYYYNCLEVRINDYEISSFIPSSIMNDFIDRTSNGIRIFDMSHNSNLADNLIYDNVELEEITNG